MPKRRIDPEMESLMKELRENALASPALLAEDVWGERMELGVTLPEPWCEDDLEWVTARALAECSMDRWAWRLQSLPKLGSVPEKAFLFGFLVAVAKRGGGDCAVWTCPDHKPNSQWASVESPWFGICCQHLVGPFRCDFQIVQFTTKIQHEVIVEIDGHDFHDRTKEQASRDRARDRHLATNGHLVLRFTGSDVYRSPVSCGEQVIDYLTSVSVRSV